MTIFEVILIALAPLLLAISAACSGSETVLFSLTHADRLQLRKSHPAVHGAVAEMLSKPRELLITVLIANTAVNIGFLIVSSMIAEHVRSHWVQGAIGVGSVLSLITFGEVLPKSIGAVHRVRLAVLVVPGVRRAFRLLAPVRGFVERWIIGPLARVFSAAARGEAPPVLTGRDLEALVDAGRREGVLDEGERRILSDVLRLGEARVKDVMTPRVDLRWLSATATTKDFLSVAKETGFSRYPVRRGREAEHGVLGVLDAQAVLPLLNRLGSDARAPIASLVEPARYVPERARLDQLLEHFRRTNSDVALCVNEAGYLTGMVQMDDVIRELVSYSTGTEGLPPDEQVTRVDASTWEIPGRFSVRDWSEFFGRADAALEPHISTVGGLIAAMLGRVPRVGDEVYLRNLRMRVVQVNGRSVERVRVTAVVEAVPTEDET